MTLSRPTRRHIAVLLLIVILLVGMIPATVAAQSESTVSGTVTVGDGETVSDLNAVAGTVVVEEGGTVTGDVSALAGNIYIDGVVEGDLSGGAGNVEISGTVDGDVAAASGNLVLADGATIGGELQAGAGNIELDGAVDGDVTVGADTIVLGENAEITGDMRYDGSLEGETGAVAGEITQDSTLGFDLAPTIQPLASWLFAVYALALNLLLGAVLLTLFPRFSDGVVDRVSSDPVRTGLAGLAVLVGVPIILVAIAITVVGIPITLVGALAFAFVVWVGIVYGRFAVAAWALSYVDIDNRWLALVVGLVAGAIVTQIPYLGSLLNLVVFLLGLGALVAGLYVRRRQTRESPLETRSDEATAG